MDAGRRVMFMALDLAGMHEWVLGETFTYSVHAVDFVELLSVPRHALLAALEHSPADR